MLSLASLQRFNKALSEFQKTFPKRNWNSDFKTSLINDFTFYSSKVENDDVEYGDTIKYLNDELVRKEKLTHLLELANHRDVLKSLIDSYETFELTEETIKSIHKNLMSSEIYWDVEYKEHLVGEYRNIPAVGSRYPHYANKEYCDHFRVEMLMSSHIPLIARKLNDIDNSQDEKHLLTRIAEFHNLFLNDIHPFADGNGRVCRIIIGTIMMKNNCPPIFKKILSHKDQMEYISKVIECEQEKTNLPLIDFLGNGLSEYLEDRVSEASF